MKIAKLFAFQKRAVDTLADIALKAQKSHMATGLPQVVSFTAPTGAGKTVMAAALMEAIYCGTEETPEQPGAIFLWLSDSPELNRQSRAKIEALADKLRPGQCVEITEDTFDRETLAGGGIYFLNTQKLGRSSRLAQHSDTRLNTIWETIEATARQKPGRLYVVIDEAHRGAKGPRGAKEATTIMQKFIKGSPEDGLSPLPVVIGMSATAERFNALAAGTLSAVYRVDVPAAEVRASGLLKDRIVITYPDDPSTDGTAVLEASAGEWERKADHWALFCERYHHAKVCPALIVQVENGRHGEATATDLAACLAAINRRTARPIAQGEAVHAFGTKETLKAGAIDIPYMEPSAISGGKGVRVVFFKESLATGWDCPRAECMMSFRPASDATYIAQLLGRMVRTPIGQRVASDESLNEVRLFLPRFDRSTVTAVVDALQEQDAALPADIVAEGMEAHTVETLGTRAALKRRAVHSGPDIPGLFAAPMEEETRAAGESESTVTALPAPEEDRIGHTATKPAKAAPAIPAGKEMAIKFGYEDIDRSEVVAFINSMGLPTYNVRNIRINNYVVSMFAMARFLTHNGVDTGILGGTKAAVADMVGNYAAKLRTEGDYGGLKARVMSFKLHSRVFDIFGEAYAGQAERDIFEQTDRMLEMQWRQAEKELGGEGVAQEYIRRHSDEGWTDAKVDLVLFTIDEGCKRRLQDYAKDRFHGMNDTYRRAVAKMADPQKRKRFADIVRDGSKESHTNYSLPDTIAIKKAQTSESGEEYRDHLYVDEKTGYAKISLNGWERDTIGEERRRSDFVCWLRNPVRNVHSLCLKHTYKGEPREFYPDFLIVRKAADGYLLDILEPHDPTRDDNVGKAKALAGYVRRYWDGMGEWDDGDRLGRVQLIRKEGGRLLRLDMCSSKVNGEVGCITSAEDLDRLFGKYGRSDTGA